MPRSHSSKGYNDYYIDRQFSTHGRPETIASNSPRFSLETSTHVYSPPYHFQLNGQAERSINTLECALQKSRGKETTEIFRSDTSIYRTTPCPVLKDHITAEAHILRIHKTIHNALLTGNPS
ncbi:unnamed protein product [Hymenolepis diminuta]|uniref:Integrase catalytic domain-containing protein n=1 Tax=Hymenolepis diminuta TaxID=6216 RepID=A0A564YH22_HYMDI|nr:unnamed protein product [Hymenolepis diminuta]